MLMLGIHKETTTDSCMPQLSFVCLAEMYNERLCGTFSHFFLRNKADKIAYKYFIVLDNVHWFILMEVCLTWNSDENDNDG
ncbi:hypothetical protein HanXRQr2_Chr01g0040681 [Helianthus annuus]|uniref:Uncharacterized protein n=1 Tax=Helianthus annuus TaxID=4232 RepID=A0A251VT35_HELAN|nr:hypothetical protein HanXRQr2_Chr01g0040681 [Helianthus annuus]KAJ0628355.1 hypothetical protein HanHA89_Chr01g0035691 [Helianthus annuus]